MAAADFNIVDKFLTDFTGSTATGFGLISSDVTAIFGLLIVISIGITAVYWAIDDTSSIVPALFRKILQIGFFIYVVNDWQGLTKTVVLGFIQIGLKAGSSGMSPDAFMKEPGNIVYLGWKHCEQFIKLIDKNSGFPEIFYNIPTAFCLLIALIGTMTAFFILAVQLFITVIEFRLVTLAALVLVPFGIIKQTSFLAERSFGYVVSTGLKLLTIALIVTIGGKTFSSINLVVDGPDVIVQSLSVLFASIIFMMLALTVPSLAAALVTGGPQLGAGSALAGAAGVAAATGGAYLAGRAGINAAAGMSKAAAGAGNRGGSPGAGASPSAGPIMQAANESGSGSGLSGSSGSAGVAPARAAATQSKPASGGSSPSGAAPSSAPSPAETVRRATARRMGSPSSHAQTAANAANSQGGAGMSATITHDEG